MSKAEIMKQIEDLRLMSVGQLQAEHLRVFGDATNSRNKDSLFKRIAWRIQANAQGSISERARQRAEDIANDADLRVRQPRSFETLRSVEAQARTTTATLDISRDPRVPIPGTILVRAYKGRNIVVQVRPNGFEYESRIYPSLSVIARKITGTQWNGLLFFKLTGERPGKVS
jgi:hypothetical protein